MSKQINSQQILTRAPQDSHKPKKVSPKADLFWFTVKAITTASQFL